MKKAKKFLFKHFRNSGMKGLILARQRTVF